MSVFAVAGEKVWVGENENLYKNLTNYINLFNMNNNMVPIKDVFFLNETLNNLPSPRFLVAAAKTAKTAKTAKAAKTGRGILYYFYLKR